MGESRSKWETEQRKRLVRLDNVADFKGEAEDPPSE